MLEALGVCYVGSPPLGLMVSRNKGLSKKVLAHHGIKVPGFITCHPGEAPPNTGDLAFPAHREADGDRRLAGDRAGVGGA